METIEVRDRRGGFLWISNYFFDTYAKTIQPSSWIVYVALARQANNSTQQCFPSYEWLSESTGLARSTVAECLQELRSAGAIEWDRKGRHNVYSLLEVNSPKNGLVRKTVPTSPIYTPYQSGGPDPNKTHNKTQEQDSFSKPSVPSGDEFSLKSDDTVSNHPKKNSACPPDPRTAVVRKMLTDLWNSLNSPDELYWEAGDGSQLKAFLKHWPKRSVRDIAQALDHYQNSEGIIETKTPKEFLPRLHLYFDGPLNKFSRPLEAKHAQA